MATAPKVGFVSLGCPKALVDSEGILTRLRAEGYTISPSYDGADLVVVNTCGFIESAMQESLEAIGEALEENGRVIVTGCLGAKGDIVRQTHPKVLAVTGPHALEEVMSAVHEHLPKPHDPFADLVPPQGIKLTPRHYAYLKISEGCNHRCTFCIIPSLRGDLVSRPISEVMREAEKRLDSFGIGYETRIMSAHRTPDKAAEYAATAEQRGLEVIICGAGAAAHLAGAIAANTTLPVIGIPIDSSSLKGLDALLATVQMPAGIPVATMAIGKAGAANAGIFAAQIVGRKDSEVAAKLAQAKKEMAAGVEERDRKLQSERKKS